MWHAWIGHRDTKTKPWTDLERSLDVDSPPSQPITLMDLIAEPRAVDWDFKVAAARTRSVPAPPLTPAFHEIVGASRSPQDAELEDVLNALSKPKAITLETLARKDLVGVCANTSYTTIPVGHRHGHTESESGCLS